MTDAQYEAKFKEMQKYIPFIQKVIEKLKVNNDHQGDNPRKAQLQKMEMLHGLLTNQAKKLKMETLLKCEGVLIKLQAKIEKNEDPLLNLSDIPSSSAKTTTNTSSSPSPSQASVTSKTDDKKVASAPASPSPERSLDVDDDAQPVVIPTERRPSRDSDDRAMSPNSSVKSKEHKPRSHDHRHRHQHQDLQRSKDSPKHEQHRKLQDTRDQILAPPRKEEGKEKSDSQPYPIHQHRTSLNVNQHSPSDRNSPLSHHRISKDLHNHSTSKLQQLQHSSLHREAVALPTKPSSSQVLQTVKVVITEPLPANIAKRHFPPYHQYRYQQSQNSPPGKDHQRCLHNIEIQPAEPKPPPERRSTTEEAYNPDESWEKYNEAQKNSKNLATKTVFTRLGDKIADVPPAVTRSPSKSSPISIPNRSTSIPEVLKSPPLSATDINNLLKESGAEHVSSDISEIGSRRTKKPESSDSKNSLDYVRKKFAQIAKINSPQITESTPPFIEIKSAEKTITVSTTPNERVALKYNPHPRQERLQSISSNDGSECSQQSATRLNTNVNDPRLKLKLQGNTILPPVGVNVLPSINVNDPRLKRQVPLSTTALSQSHLGMSSNNPLPSSATASTPIISNFPRNDPRIARQLSQQSAVAQQPLRKISTTHISPEENWDADPDDHINKNDPRISKAPQRQQSASLESSAQVTPLIRRKGISRELPPTILKSYTPNPPSNDSEENWDSDTETMPVQAMVKEPFPKTNINKNDPRFSRDMQRQPAQVVPPIRRQSISQTLDVSGVSSDHLFAANVPIHDIERSWDSKPGVIPTLARDQPLLNHNTMSRSSTFVPFGAQPLHPPYVANPYGLLPNSTSPPVIPFSAPSHFVQGGACATTGNRFNSSLNDSKERMKYFESKKQKTTEARTYVEFKKAKEAANRKALEKAQAVTNRKIEEAQVAKKTAAEEKPKKDSEQKEKTKNKLVEQNSKQQEEMEANKIKDIAAAPAGESTLDKMYRTQNFTTQFPKASISFKIPKKKSEDNSTSSMATVKDAVKKANEIQVKTNATKTNAKSKKAAGQKTSAETAAPKLTKQHFTPDPPKIGDAEENWDSDTEPSVVTTPTMASDKSENHKENSQVSEKLFDAKSDRPIDNAGKLGKSRDPRCRPQEMNEPSSDTASAIPETVKNIEGISSESKNTSNITNKKKFLDDAITHSFSSTSEFKPQRILRRRCTMVSIGSAPLVDKDKLLKANALMLEDIEERDKLKRKKEEEERQMVRRNKQLAEMFQKTDDNCTVSTQNIITGKRRTRPSINFNETQNAINVFKHLSVTKKDSNTPVTPPAQAAAGKTTRSRAKQKATAENESSKETSKEPAETVNTAKKELNEKTDDKLEDNKKETVTNCTEAVNDRTVTKAESEEKYDDAVLSANIEEKDEESIKDRSALNESSEEKIAETDDETTAKIKTVSKKGKKVGKAPAVTAKPTREINKLTKNNPHLEEVDLSTTSTTSSAHEMAATVSTSEEHQNCVVSSSTSAEMPFEENTSASTAAISSLKEEVDDNEPSSTGSKSSNPTPTPPEDDSSRHAFLNEFVQEIIKPNADKQHILSLLGQILSEDKLQIIKTVIDSTITQTDEDKNDDNSTKSKESTKENNKVHKGDKTTKTLKHEVESAAEEEHQEDEEDQDDSPSTSLKTPKAGRSTPIVKKKRNELERLNDDIRDMFICQGVLTASGKRMCTLMSQTASKKDAESPANKRAATAQAKAESDTCAKRKVGPSKVTKPMSKPLRRSLRGCKTTEVSFENANDDEIEITTYMGCEDLTDEINNSDLNNTNDTTPTRRKMPVLKPHTPIKLPEETEVKNLSKESHIKRKASNKPCPKSKKAKQDDDSGKESETESGSVFAESDDEGGTQNTTIKNTNVHWHNQSKYTSWCMLCNKKILALSSSFHYKMHHGENYISRLAPVLVQKFKQGKLCQPLFGVVRTPKQPSWFHRCPFCLQYFNTALPLWLEHFQNHTAEFHYECSKCHWGSNRMASTRRHIAARSCKGATVVNSVVKLTEPSVIKAHVCHLCNFIQLKRANLERHYIEQHQLAIKNIDLLGYTITLFDYAGVERVSEDKAQDKEEKARQLIAKDEQIIDVDDDDNHEGGEDETSEKKDNDKTKKVNKETHKKNEKEAVVTSPKKDSTTPEVAEETDVPNQQSQSNKETVTNESTKNADNESNVTKDLQSQENASTIIETRDVPEESVESDLDELDAENIPLAKLAAKKATSTSLTTKPAMPEVDAATKELTPVNTPETIATPSKVATPATPSVSTTPKAQIAIAKSNLPKENITQNDSKKRKTEAQSVEVGPTEIDALCDPLMSVSDKQTTKQPEHLSTPTKQTEGGEDLSNNAAYSSEMTTVTPTSPSVQIAVRKYTLVFTDTNHGSLEEVPDNANKKLSSFNCHIINKDDDAKEVQDELLSLAAQVAEEQESEETTDHNESDNKMDNIQVVEATQNTVQDEQHAVQDQPDVQDVQDELLSLAAQAAEDQEKEESRERNCNMETMLSTETNPTEVSDQHLANTDETKMSDLISGSIDMLFQRSKRKSDETQDPENIAKKHCFSHQSHLPTTSNVFVPSRVGTNSPPIQILAQSIVNIEEQDKILETSHKPVTTSIAERLSQRFKVLQEKAKALKETQIKERLNQNECHLEETKPVTDNQKQKDISEDKKPLDIVKTKEPEKTTHTDEVTVISDDEDWEDIEITESAPNTGSYNSNNLQKAKNKGLFQKFGIFKANTGKVKKHIAPLAFMPKKKITKEKISQQHSSSSSPITTKSANADKPSTSSISPAVHLGFKPVINIMEDLLPDSPCNDPIDLVPELTPLEPLTDLNDISSILDSNLSAMGSVSLHIDESHTCIQDALDFISEQTAHEHQSSKTLYSAGQVQTKSPTNKVQNVGYSLQSQKESSVKFYCLLENCSFLFSSDPMGLENHFLCEHSQIKWKGYCLLCQAQCFPNDQEYSISKEIKHMVEKHVNGPMVEPNSDSSQHSTTTGQGGEEKPRIKLRRMTGDCLSTSNSESPTPSSSSAPQSANATTATPQSNTLLGALLNAKPMPPTKEMPPQPEMPLTEPLLIDNNLMEPSPPSSFTNVSSDFVITSVASGHQAQTMSNQDKPLQIASVVSLSQKEDPPLLPKISNVCTLSSKATRMWSQQIEEEREELLESATSLEVSNILANARKPSYRREPSRRSQDESPGPVVVAETVPVGQAKAGDFVITQTVSAQYGDDSAAAVGFNISIQTSALANLKEISNVEVANPLDNVETVPTSGVERLPSSIRSEGDSSLVMTESVPSQLFNMPSNSPAASDATTLPITSRQYKCMGNGCKFTTRVPVAMSDHLRFHERRNLSLKCDYFACAFCSYQADDVDDYMKHSDQYHIISKGNKPAAAETDVPALAPLTSRNICDILSKKMENSASKNVGSTPEIQRNLIVKQKESEEEYIKKLRTTIDEIVGPTGFPDDKLYRCVIKNCRTQLTEATFHNHILYHISTLGISNPNNYIFKCPHCMAQYYRPAGIKAHIKNHARNRYFCYLCEVTSANPGQMLKHFSDKHWHTLNMCTKELLQPKFIVNGDDKQVQDSSYYVAYINELSDDEVRKYGEKLILEWQRKKSGSKTHFKSSEIDLLPMQPIFQRDVNCGECEYKTKVRTNMYRHLLMHKQYSQLPNSTGQAAVVASVDPVNPVPCLNSTERFFDKMTNLASSSLIPSQPSSSSNTTSKNTFKPPRVFVADADRYKCGIPDCNYITISEGIFHSHLSTLHGAASSYRCPFCQEDICKRGMSVDRVISHLRFHASTLYRCDECNYSHYLRYVVERHVNEKHATMKVNIVKHDRAEGNMEGKMTTKVFTGKNYKDNTEANQSAASSASTSNSTTATRLLTGADVPTKSSNTGSSSSNAKSKAKWICDICKHKVSTLAQIQMHCQNSHGQNKPYQCMHCQFGSQQLSQILYHVDEIHPDKTRNARYIYHKMANDEELDVEETRPLWQRNDPTRVRHIRGILMEDEEESEKYRQKLGLDKAVDDEEDNDENDDEDPAHTPSQNFMKGYEFGCFHCDFTSERFDELCSNHYKNVHSSPLELTKPFMFRLVRRVCCPECRKFTGNFYQMQLHLLNTHNIRNYYAADITIAENDDNSQRLVCGYCSFHCLKPNHLMRHFQSAKVLHSHSPQDVRIESHQQMMDILKLGTNQSYYQCTLCSQIFGNRVAIVHHAVNFHANDEGFSFKEQTNTLIYCCALCSFSSTTESLLLRHMVDHYSRFKKCTFCYCRQISFEHYMQHCYAEHREDIRKFRDLYSYKDISNFLMQLCILFPNGLVLSKNNLLKSSYGSDTVIQQFYEEMYKISQQPPIPRLSIARLVARKSIEAHHKHTSASSSPQHCVELITDDVTTTPTPSTSQAKKITKRRFTVAIGQEDDDGRSITSTATNKISKSTTETSNTIAAKKRKPSLVVEHESSSNQSSEFNVPLAHSMKIKKRRRTVASDHNEKSPSPYSSQNSPQSFVSEGDVACKIPKIDDAPSNPSTSPAPSNKENSPLELEYFSYYGIKPEPLDLSKIYTKVAIGGINTPLTIDKFRLLFNIDCQLKLTKCDVLSHVPVYTQYKHIRKACPASHKLRFS